MKRLVLLVSAFVLIVNILGGFSATHTFAQAVPPATVIPPTGVVVTDLELGSAVPASGVSTVQNDKDDGTCSLFGASSIANCLSVGFQWIIKNILLEIGGFMVWLTANMFNYAIKIGVLEFSSWAPDSLYPIWLIVRQIVSLIIVFIGLYLGFMYILGKDGFQKYIPWVIMFALFVNFSYPLVRTAIDLSNIISLKIYVSAVGSGVLEPSTASDAGSLIVSKLGLQGLAASAVSSKGGTGLVTSINSVPAALLAVCYVFYTAYIFFMVTALFVMRTAALVFLIVASPILLVDSVLPMLGERAKLVRKIFFEQLAIGPIFMLMLALTLKFLDVFSASGKLSASGLSGAASGTGADTIGVFFNILMMLIMLWIMLKVTKSTAGTLGEYATSAMGTVGGFAVGAAAGGTGLLARKGLGGLAMKARDSKWVQNNQDSFLGRRAYNLSNTVANSTFDLRNSAVAQKYAGKMGISSGMGTGAKMGQEEYGKAKLKDAIERSSRIKTHHERDVYKDKIGEDGKVVYEDVTDKDGKVVKKVKAQELVHRKGDVDAAGWEAKTRFIANSGGGTMFLTKEQKQKQHEALGEEANKDSDKRIAEVEANSTKDTQIYKNITEDETLPDGTIISKKQSKARFLAGLENELENLKKTDPTLQGNQTQSLMKSIQSIKKTEAIENAAFDKQVQYVLSNYSKKSGADADNYLSNQSQDIHDAVRNIITNEQNAAKDTTQSGPLDLDITQGNGGATVQTTAPLVTPTASAPVTTSVQAQPRSNVINSAIVDQNGRNFQYTVDPQTKAVNIVSPDAGTPFDVSTVSFSARVAGRNRPTSPVAGTPIPSPTATAPSAPAANESNAAQSA